MTRQIFIEYAPEPGWFRVRLLDETLPEGEIVQEHRSIGMAFVAAHRMLKSHGPAKIYDFTEGGRHD